MLPPQDDLGVLKHRQGPRLGTHKRGFDIRLRQVRPRSHGRQHRENTQDRRANGPRTLTLILDAMLANPDFDVLITGRAYDPAPYIAYAAFASESSLEDTAGLSVQRLWGGFTPMGKILECGGVCAVPKSHGAMATVYQDGTFDVAPLDPKSRCTRISVAAHTLYEKSRPDILHGPGGYLDLAN
jgi:hypothetical protein